MPTADKWLDLTARARGHQETLDSLLGIDGFDGARSYNVERG